jgi:hypothetical protein
MSLVSVDELAMWRGLDAPSTGSPQWETQQAVLDAVETHISHSYVLPTPLPEDARNGILIAAARLIKRKDSPQGIEDFGEFGAVRISRMDPDVEALLSPYKTWALA